MMRLSGVGVDVGVADGVDVFVGGGVSVGVGVVEGVGVAVDVAVSVGVDVTVGVEDGVGVFVVVGVAVTVGVLVGVEVGAVGVIDGTGETVGVGPWGGGKGRGGKVADGAGSFAAVAACINAVAVASIMTGVTAVVESIGTGVVVSAICVAIV